MEKPFKSFVGVLNGAYCTKGANKTENRHDDASIYLLLFVSFGIAGLENISVTIS